jgi:hypothetical protein
MTRVFFAYSGLDRTILETILKDLKLSKEHYYIWYYQPGMNDVPMEKIGEVIATMDIFLLLLTENSLSSHNVQAELEIAFSEHHIKEIYSILIDDRLMKDSPRTIPESIQCKTYYSNSVISAAEITRGILSDYEN